MVTSTSLQLSNGRTATTIDFGVATNKTPEPYLQPVNLFQYLTKPTRVAIIVLADYRVDVFDDLREEGRARGWYVRETMNDQCAVFLKDKTHTTFKIVARGVKTPVHTPLGNALVTITGYAHLPPGLLEKDAQIRRDIELSDLLAELHTHDESRNAVTFFSAPFDTLAGGAQLPVIDAYYQRVDGLELNAYSVPRFRQATLNAAAEYHLPILVASNAKRARHFGASYTLLDQDKFNEFLMMSSNFGSALGQLLDAQRAERGKPKGRHYLEPHLRGASLGAASVLIGGRLLHGQGMDVARIAAHRLFHR